MPFEETSHGHLSYLNLLESSDVIIFGVLVKHEIMFSRYDDFGDRKTTSGHLLGLFR
jgi:hypothetical protein